MVWPFVKKLRTSIKQRRKAAKQQQPQQQQQQQGAPPMLTEFEAAQLAAEKAISGTSHQQQQQQAVPSMLSAFEAAHQAADKALGNNENTTGEAQHRSLPRCFLVASSLPVTHMLYPSRSAEQH